MKTDNQNGQVITEVDENNNVVRKTYYVPVTGKSSDLAKKELSEFIMRCKEDVVFDENTGTITMTRDYPLPIDGEYFIPVAEMTDKESELIIHKNMYCD